jgi:hypothetical protein
MARRLTLYMVPFGGEKAAAGLRIKPSPEVAQRETSS